MDLTVEVGEMLQIKKETWQGFAEPPKCASAVWLERDISRV